MTLEQLTAFAISDDHKKQEELWFESPYEDLPAQFIRRQLTRSQVEGSDRRVRFVGLDTYEAAGGVVIRDLFDSAHEGYLADSQLLDRLVAEKLDVAAQALQNEGWSWVETLAEEDYSYLASFGRVPPSEIDLPKKDEKRLAALADRYDELVSAIEDEEDETVRNELDRIDAEIAVLRARKEVWTDAAKAGLGTVLMLGGDGTLSVTRGLVRGNTNGASSETRVKQKTARTGYLESVLLDLSAHRTAAMRASLVDQPRTAFLLMLYALVCQVFFGRGAGCLEIGVTETSLDRASQSVTAGKAMQAFLAHRSQWAERMPDADGLWDWILALTEAERLSLLALCVATGVNGLRAGQSEADGSDRLSEILGLDMTQWWVPDVSFFSRLTKAEVLDAVKQVLGEKSAYRLESLKKPELTQKAEALLANSGWLPKPWRKAEPEDIAAE